ncbi:LysR family transcriptional regulator, partial [Escherichia coli]|nr:LysR family transcriptional regulator [Escherichia coli]
AGLGVALVPRLYIEAELELGRLVALWPDGKAITKNFCLVLPEPIELAGGPLQAFAKCMLSEPRGARTVHT